MVLDLRGQPVRLGAVQAPKQTGKRHDRAVAVARRAGRRRVQADALLERVKHFAAAFVELEQHGFAVLFLVVDGGLDDGELLGLSSQQSKTTMGSMGWWAWGAAHTYDAHAELGKVLQHDGAQVARDAVCVDAVHGRRRHVLGQVLKDTRRFAVHLDGLGKRYRNAKKRSKTHIKNLR